MTIDKSYNGSFKIEIKSHDNIGVTAYNGKFKIGYEILIDGSFKVTDFSMAPKFGAQASELAATLKDTKTSEKDLTSDLTKAYKEARSLIMSTMRSQML